MAGCGSGCRIRTCWIRLKLEPCCTKYEERDYAELVFLTTWYSYEAVKVVKSGERR
jgi:hypothetical protein